MIRKDISCKTLENIEKGAKQKKKESVARTSDRTIKKLLKTENAPASGGEKSHG